MPGRTREAVGTEVGLAGGRGVGISPMATSKRGDEEEEGGDDGGRGSNGQPTPRPLPADFKAKAPPSCFGRTPPDGGERRVCGEPTTIAALSSPGATRLVDVELGVEVAYVVEEERAVLPGALGEVGLHNLRERAINVFCLHKNVPCPRKQVRSMQCFKSCKKQSFKSFLFFRVRCGGGPERTP